MKPTWNDAPKWANYLAQNYYGKWHWFEKKPYADSNIDAWISCGDLTIEIREIFPDWKSTLESNPIGFCQLCKKRL
jgi:hypothetical protein